MKKEPNQPSANAPPAGASHANRGRRSSRTFAPPVKLDRELIAPCGMYCGVCSSYLAQVHQLPRQRGKITHCAGCRPRDKQCAYLKGQCELLATGSIRYCFECPTYPCRNLAHIDQRYRQNYGMSFLENLNLIRDRGEKALLKSLAGRFACGKCGELTSIHNGKCFRCDEVKSWRGC